MTHDVFAAIRAGDVLVHHPYESFEESVEHFIAAAADDPETVVVKMTAYRIGDDTPFVKSLIQAAESGQAGGLRHRDQGALRRRAQSALGGGTGAGRRARDVRGAGSEDARKARAGGAQRIGRAAQLRPHRHRKLSCADRAALRRLRAVHLQSHHHARRGESVPLPDRPLTGARVFDAAGGAGNDAAAGPGADRAGDRQPARRHCPRGSSPR